MNVPWRNLTLGIFFGAQIFGIVAARFGPERYFCWAPYDEITLFDIAVTVDGRQLSEGEIRARYRLPEAARDNHSHANVISVIAHFEQTYGAADRAQVALNYRVNGGSPQQWHWPLSAGESSPSP